MPAFDGRQPKSDVDYESVESAVLETAKGRWFLAEHARRHRVADTQTLLDALRKIEKTVVPAGNAADLAPLVQAIRQTREEIAAVRNHMLEGAGALGDDPALFGNIAEESRAAASELMGRTSSIQTASGLLKADGADTSVLETEATGLQTLAWRQDVMSQRISKALGLLSHIGDRLESLAGSAVAEPPKLTDAHLAYFKQDEDLFTADPTRVQQTPAIVERPRIIMIRRSSIADLPVPAEGDSAA